MTKRQVFYSFHYSPDSWRTSQVRNIGAIEGNQPTSDNHWEQIKSGGENAIKRWINNQMQYRSCTVVLIGSNTANRKWINYEIVKSWNDRMGVVGIHIHGLRDRVGSISHKGRNPFDYINYGGTGKKLSAIIRCYDPAGTTSQQKYAWISKHLLNAIEEAIRLRQNST